MLISIRDGVGGISMVSRRGPSVGRSGCPREADPKEPHRDTSVCKRRVPTGMGSLGYGS